MTIDLKPEQQRIIDLAIESGAYRDPSEVLDQALALIRAQLEVEDWLLEERERVAAHVEEGFAQAERGELVDVDEVIETLQKRRDERRTPRK
jgi:antitoxin ParD1/3/4